MRRCENRDPFRGGIELEVTEQSIGPIGSKGQRLLRGWVIVEGILWSR